MRGIGQGIREFKNATNSSDIKKDIKDIAAELKEPLNKKTHNDKEMKRDNKEKER